MRVFTEEQRFDQWWFRALMIFVLAVTLLPLVLFFDEIAEDAEALVIVSIALGFTMLIVAWIMFFLKLTTRIDEHGIYYSFWPFVVRSRTIPWSEIKECYVRKYNPIGEYGGWGYRIKLGKGGKAINVKGNIGVQIVLQNDKKLLLGTQNEFDARSVISTYEHKFKRS